MHTTKKRRSITKKEKSCYNDQFLVAPALTPSRQYQKSSFSKSDASKEGNSAQAPLSPDHRS
jgi:hypothetical protein